MIVTIAKPDLDTVESNLDYLKFHHILYTNETDSPAIRESVRKLSSIPTSQHANVNQSKRGVEPASLQVYSWFDEYENLNQVPLTHEEVKNLMKKGKAAINNAETTLLDILWEELVDGPFFEDDRCETKDEETKANHSLNTQRPEQENGSTSRDD